MNSVLFINGFSSDLVVYLWTVLLQSSILILMLFGLDILLRRKIRAVLRYCLWMLLLVKLVLPIGFAIPYSPAYWIGNAIANAKTSNQKTIAPATIELEQAPIASITEPLTQLSDLRAAEQTVANIESASITPVAEVIADESKTAKEPTTITQPLEWEVFVALGWGTIVLVLMGLLVQRALFVRSLIRQSSDADGKLILQLKRCADVIGIKQNITLRISPNATSPSVCGLVNPTILIPANLTEHLDAKNIDAVLLHELAHIKRGDLWVNLIQSLLQIVHFYNPLLWFANAKIRTIREQAVDEMVLVAMEKDAEDYPEALLKISKLVWSRPMLSLRLIGVVESKSALAERIKHILNRPLPRSAKIGTSGLLMVIFFAAILLPMARGEGKNSRKVASAPKNSAYEIANGSKNYKIKVGPTRFEATSVTRWLGNGKIITTNPQNSKVLSSSEDSKHFTFPDQDKWMDIAQVHFSPSPKDYDLIELRIFDHYTREYLSPKDGSGIGYSSSNSIVTMCSTGIELPESIDVWMRVMHNKGEKSAEIKAAKDAFTEIDGNTLRIKEFLNGRYNWANGKTTKHHEEWDDKVVSVAFEFDKGGSKEYQVCAVTKDGKRIISPDAPHFLRGSNGWQLCTFPAKFDNLSHFEFASFEGRDSFFFDDVRLPKRIAKLEPMPKIRFTTNGKDFEQSSKIASIANVQFELIGNTEMQGMQSSTSQWGSTYTTAPSTRGQTLLICKCEGLGVSEITFAMYNRNGKLIGVDGSSGSGSQYGVRHSIHYIENEVKVKDIDVVDVYFEKIEDLPEQIEVANPKTISETIKQEIAKTVNAFFKAASGDNLEAVMPYLYFESDELKQQWMPYIKEMLGNSSLSGNVRVMNVKQTKAGDYTVAILQPVHNEEYVPVQHAVINDNGSYKLNIFTKEQLEMSKMVKEKSAEEIGRYHLEKQLKVWREAEGGKLQELVQTMIDNEKNNLAAYEYANKNSIKLMQHFNKEAVEQRLNNLQKATPEELRAEMLKDEKLPDGTKKQINSNELKTLAIACKMYNLDTGKWPASLEELLSTKGNGPYIKMSENGYDFNKTVFIGINSKPASEIKTAETILAYDLSGVRPDTSGKAAIIFADGHIEYWTKGKLDENLNIVKPKADSGRGIYGTIYDAPSEDWWEEYFTKLANAETMSEFSRILESQVNTKKPASGITVRLIDTLGKARITKETITDENGKYEFTELGVGKYQISAEKMTVSKRTGNTSDAIAQSRWFELYESSLHPKRVEQNLSLDDGYITVSGRVLDESGKPMAGAKVCGTSTPLENDGIGETDETTRIFAAQQICEITDENGYYELKGFRAANFYDTFRYLINTNKGIRGAYKFFVNITADSQDGTYRGKLERIPLVGENQAYRARCLLNELNKLCEKTGEEVHPENMDLEWPLAKSKGGKLVDVDIHLERKISEPNFDDLSFWQGEIAKYMQAVRTVDGEFISSRQVYEKGKKEPKTYRKEIKFKWNRDNTWYDYSVSDLENNLHQTRVVRNSTEAWWENSGGKSANRTKPEDNGGMIMQGFGFSPEDKWWPGDALDINSVATLIASRELRGLKYQAKWDLMPQACKPLDNNQYELTLKSQMTWGWPAKQSDMTLIVEWDGAMKPISINYKVDNDKPIVKCMWSDHIKVGDNWFARKAIQYEYDGETEFEKTALVSEATTIIAKKVIFNRPITEDEFKYVPATGLSVFDKIEETHYVGWPDFETIRATGGKERISISGDVLVDGKPVEGVTVSTHTLYEYGKDVYKTVSGKADSEGKFTLDGLLPGFEYRIQASTGTGSNTSATVQTAENGIDVTDLKLQISTGYILKGKVSRYDGTPAKKAVVKVEGLSEIRTKDDGTFEVTGMKTGASTIKFADKGCAPLKLKYDFNIEKASELLNITLKEEQVLTGRMIDKNSEPMAKKRIIGFFTCFVGSQWQWCNTYTDSDGYFKLGNLGDEAYGIWIEEAGNRAFRASDSPVLIRTVNGRFALDDKPGRLVANKETLAIIKNIDKQFIDLFLDEMNYGNDGRRAYNNFEAICQHLKDIDSSDLKVSKKAMASLGNLEAVQAVEKFVEIIQKNDNKDKVLLAIRGLGRIGHVPTIKTLIEISKQADTVIAAYAKVAMCEIAGTSYGDESAWTDWLKEYEKNRKKLDTRGPDRLLESFMKNISEGKVVIASAAFLPGYKGQTQILRELDDQTQAKYKKLYEAIEWPKVNGGNCYMMHDKIQEQNWYCKFKENIEIDGKQYKKGESLVFTGVCREYNQEWWILELKLN